MTNTYLHAKRELDILAATVSDAIAIDFREELLALCEKFGNSGQSGGSAPYVASALSQIIKPLLLQETVCPIQGTDDEWVDVAQENGLPMYQNNRCSALFKNGKDATPYYLDAIVWKGPGKYNTFTGKVDGVLSRQFIKEFPFTPKTFYIDVIEVKFHGEHDYQIKDRKQLNKVWKYYAKPEEMNNYS